MRSLALISILALTLAACGGGSSGDGAPATGTLKVMVTDDPFPFPADLVAYATIDIIRVEARNADLEGWQILFDGEAVPEPDPDADSEADPLPAPGAMTIDLIPLSGGVTQLLTEVQVPVGTYDEVRLIVDAGEILFKANAEVDTPTEDDESLLFSVENGKLRFPSGAQSGIKVKIENDLVVAPDSSGLSADLVLEFDLAHNFVFNGSPAYGPGVKRINFTPVVRAVNMSTNGSITLQAMADNDPDEDTPLPGTTVFVYEVTLDETSGDEIVAEVPSSHTCAEDGRCTISLTPGTYNLTVLAQGYDPVYLEGIPVVLANLYDAGQVEMQVANFWLEGQVFSDGTLAGDTSDDSALSGATVELWDADPDADPPVAPPASKVGDTLTNADGMYFFTGLTPGTYVVRVVAGGHASALIPDVTVDPGVITIQNAILQPE